LSGAALIVAALVAAAPVAAQSGSPAASINAEGNVFTGGLRFNPDSARVKVGDLVRWTNTDFLVPHTATEDHGLWNLTGTYGATPATPPGFAPGETRERRFAAGTWSYFCEVHPTQMHGTIVVPVDLSSRPAGKHKKKRKGKRHGRLAGAAKKKRKRGKLFEIVAVWGAEDLPRGQVFDVQARQGSGDWKTVLDGTRDQRGTFPGGPRGTSWTFRARVRRDGEASRASGYSPDATITVG
jgi:plastocyanin